MNKITKIYVDLDGVLADFDKRYGELYHMNPREAEKEKKFYHYFEEFIETKQFEQLDLLPDARELITFLEDQPFPVEILSSTAHEKTYDVISAQKLNWLKKHNIKFTPNFVPGKKHKYKFATPTHVIIDDTRSVIEDWDKAGGYGIWHRSAAGTVAEIAPSLVKTILFG